ncbi:hypothetical protein MSEO_31530 [Mycobacterium seoulense]|uniref:Uncharacterized protein n=1 Tax=Mycobacterium seoulense TaxID=386911 RepID=A0A7I7P2C5_9MYCO|nr:hypothetical protein MSEO_31530 [Mycobacterium seoulense]
MHVVRDRALGVRVGHAARIVTRDVLLAGIHQRRSGSGGDDVGAFLSQSHRVAAALAARRAGHEGDLALHAHVCAVSHRFSFQMVAEGRRDVSGVATAVDTQ